MLKSTTVTNQTLTADQLVGGHVSFQDNGGPAATITMPTVAEIFTYLTREWFTANGDPTTNVNATTLLSVRSIPVTSFRCTFSMGTGNVPTLSWASGLEYYPSGPGNAALGGTTFALTASTSLTFEFFTIQPSSVVSPRIGFYLVWSVGLGGAYVAPNWSSVLAVGNTSGAFDPTINNGQQIQYVGGIRIGGNNLATGATAAAGISIGSSSSASQATNIAIGSTALATGLTGAIVIGSSSAAINTSGVVVGSGSQATGIQGVVVGYGSQSNADYAVALGPNALASAASAVALGNFTVAQGANSVAIGNAATTVLLANSVALGAGATATAANQIMMGTAAETVSFPGDAQFTDTALGTTNALALNYLAGVPVGAATNGSILVDGTDSRLYVRIGAAWKYLDVPTGAGVGTWASVLAAGNTSGATNPTISAGQNLLYATGIQIGTVGFAATANATGIAIGTSAQANGVSSVSIGPSANANGGGAVAIGSGTNATTLGGTAVGPSASVTVGTNATALGASSVCSANNTVAVGYTAQADSIGNVAVGGASIASGLGATAVGYNAATAADYTTAIGCQTLINLFGPKSTCVGWNASSSYTQSTALGYNATCSAANQIMLGTATETVTFPGKGLFVTGVAIGSNNVAATATTATSIAIGPSAWGQAANSIAIGQSATGSGSTAIAIGQNSSATGTQAVALGYNAGASAASTTAIGYNTIASASNGTAIGYGASTAGFADSTAVGTGAICTAIRQIYLGNASTGTHVTVGGHIGSVQGFGTIIVAAQLNTGTCNLEAGSTDVAGLVTFKALAGFTTFTVRVTYGNTMEGTYVFPVIGPSTYNGFDTIALRVTTHTTGYFDVEGYLTIASGSDIDCGFTYHVIQTW
jgi:hypothetical protein